MTVGTGRLVAALFFVLFSAVTAAEESAVLMGSWGQGLFRLPPGEGSKWEPYGKNLPQAFITFTTVDSKGTIYCGFDTPQLMLSRDSGQTWEQAPATPPGTPSGLAVHPDNPLILLLTTWGKGAWWSEDGGKSWAQEESPSPFMRKPLSARKEGKVVFYALADDNKIVLTNGIRGEWKEVAKIPKALKAWDLAVRDADKGILLAATDAGVAEIGADGAVNFPKLGIPSAFTRSILVPPNRVLIGTWGDGVIEWNASGARFLNDGLPDRNAFSLAAISASSVAKASEVGDTGPATWTVMNNGLTNFVVKNISASPQNAKIMYCATDSGVHRTDDGGKNWTPVSQGLSDLKVSRVVINPSNSEVVYCCSSSAGAAKSVDGGKKWVQANKGVTNLNMQSISVDPRNGQVLYAATWDGGFLKSEDGAESWKDITGSLSPPQGYIVFCGGQSPYPVIASVEASGLFSLQEGKWVDANKGMNFGWVFVVAQDPANGKKLIAGTAGSGIFLSEDGGLSWKQSNAGLTNQTVNAIAYHPGKPGVIYAGTAGGGLFKSADGGASWKQDNEGLTSMKVADVLVAPSGMVYLSTETGVFSKQD